MSAILIDAEPVGTYTSGRQNCVGVVYCDTQADLPAPDDFTCHLMLGSRAEVMDGTVWRMKSDGTWEQQPAPNTTQLDLSGYYTTAQVDALIAAASVAALGSGTELQANSDLDALLTAGSWYCAATNANSCANRPLGATTGGFGVKNFAYFSDNRFVQVLTYNVVSGTAFNRFFVRVYRSNGWGSWDEIQKTPV